METINYVCVCLTVCRSVCVLCMCVKHHMIYAGMDILSMLSQLTKSLEEIARKILFTSIARHSELALVLPTN